MTDEQFEDCKQCLNRKRGINEKENICNIRGKNMEFENKCSEFEYDTNVVLGTENKIKAIRPNLQRAKIAQILVLVVMLFDIISIYSSYLQYNLLKILQNDGLVTNEMIESNDSREQIIGITYILILIISSITFIQWFRRAYFNLNVRSNCEHSEGWAAGSWFTPIISLYRPYQIMKEMFEKTTNMINSKSPDQKENNYFSIIGLWWTLWIVSNYIGNYLLKSSFRDETIENYINSTIGQIVNSTIGIPLAILAILIIRVYSLKEEKINELEKKEAKTIRLNF